MFRVYGIVDNQLFSAWKDENKKNFCKLGTSKSRARPRGGMVPRGMGYSEVFHQYFNQITAWSKRRYLGLKPWFKSLIKSITTLSPRGGGRGAFIKISILNLQSYRMEKCLIHLFYTLMEKLSSPISFSEVFFVFVVRLHLSAGELLLYPRRPRRRPCQCPRPHAKC